MGLVLRYLPVIIIVLTMIYATVDAAQTDSDRIRYMPKWMWVVAIICFPLIGAAFWLLFGKWPEANGPSNNKRPKAPDDDTDFLRSL